MTEERAKVVLREEAVLEKFDGEVTDPDRVLRERITLVDGEIIKHEFFDEQGEVTHLIEGGTDATN